VTRRHGEPRPRCCGPGPTPWSCFLPSPDGRCHLDKGIDPVLVVRGAEPGRSALVGMTPHARRLQFCPGSPLTAGAHTVLCATPARSCTRSCPVARAGQVDPRRPLDRPLDRRATRRASDAGGRTFAARCRCAPREHLHVSESASSGRRVPAAESLSGEVRRIAIRTRIVPVARTDDPRYGIGRG